VEYQDPIATEKVTISSPTDLDVIAQCAGVDTDLIRLVNPELIRNMTPPNRPGYVLNLPRGTKANFQARYARLDSSERLKNVRYVAEKGESLRSIAQDHGVTVSSLVAANPSLENRRSVPSKTTLIVPKAYDSPPPVPISTTYASASRGKRLIDLIADRSDDSDGKKSKKDKKKKEEKIAPPSDRTEDGEMKVAWKTSEPPSEPVAANSPDSGNPAPESSPSAGEENSNTDAKIADGSSPNGTQGDGGGIGVKHSWEEPTPASAKSKVRERTVAYRVKRGDTLAAIADKYNVSVADLREWNRLSAKRGLLANQKLVIRTTETEKERRGGFSLIRSAYADEGTRAKKKSPALASKSTPKVIAYKVRKGDTLHGIARKYDVTPSEILAMNGLSKRTVIRPGLVLKIPARSLASRG
jgi:peptidoglycan lytic transglycosylase D